MSTAHFILQGKGGVGKSMIASILYQYFDNKGVDIRAIDTDPVNHSLESYQTFNVELHDILDGKNIDQGKWDTLIDKICDEVPANGHIIIDNGASSFLALTDYIYKEELTEILKDAGVTPFFHVIITGGDALQHTLEGIDELLEVLPEGTNFVVWVNPFFGKVQMGDRTYMDFKTIKENKARLKFFIELPDVDKQTLGRDLIDLFTRKVPMNDAIKSDQTHRMTKSRLKRYRDKIFSYIDTIGFDIVPVAAETVSTAVESENSVESVADFSEITDTPEKKSSESEE